MQSELEARKSRYEMKLAKNKLTSSSSLNPQSPRSNTFTKQPSPHAQKVKKSFSNDVNNNASENEQIYEVIPNNDQAEPLKSYKKQNGYKTIAPNKASTAIKNTSPPVKSVSSPRFSLNRTSLKSM